MEAPKNKEEWLARRTADLGRSEDYARELETAHAQLLNKAKSMQRELSSFRGSLSWRLTAPLRALQRLIIGGNEIPSAVDLPWPRLPERTVASSEMLPMVRHPRRIGVDVSSLCESNAGGGVQRVVRQIATHLAETSTADEIVLLDLRRGWPTDATFRFLKTPETESRAELPCLEFHTLLLLDASWRFLDAVRPILQAARSADIRVVSCVYDLIPVDYPETCQPDNRDAYLQWLPAAVSLSDSFVCISQAVGRRLAKYLADEGVRGKKRIGWWNLGSDFEQSDSVPKSRRVEGNYVLMVGTLEPRKCHELALDAFEIGWKEGRFNEALVIAGRLGWGMESFQERIKNHAEWGKRLFWFQDVDDQELAGLYANAAVFLQASCAEGFGLPIVEGAQFRKPVVLSDLPVFREIVQSDGYFFESGNSRDLVNTLVRPLMTDAAPTKVIQTTWAQSTAELKALVQTESYPLEHL